MNVCRLPFCRETRAKLDKVCPRLAKWLARSNDGKKKRKMVCGRQFGQLSNVESFALRILCSLQKPFNFPWFLGATTKLCRIRGGGVAPPLGERGFRHPESERKISGIVAGDFALDLLLGGARISSRSLETCSFSPSLALTPRDDYFVLHFCRLAS